MKSGWHPAILGIFGILSVATTLAGCAPTGDSDVKQGLLLFDARQFEAAIPHLERGLEQPLRSFSRSDILTIIGNCHYELGQLDLALDYHDQAIAEDPKNVRAHVNKGIVYRLLENYAAAEACYAEAMKISPEYAELHGSMGALAIVQGKFDEAIEHLKRSIQLDDDHPVAHSNLAIAYASVGRFEEADAELQHAIDLGYHQPELIQERIDKLRESATPEGDSP